MRCHGCKPRVLHLTVSFKHRYERAVILGRGCRLRDKHWLLDLMKFSDDFFPRVVVASEDSLLNLCRHRLLPRAPSSLFLETLDFSLQLKVLSIGFVVSCHCRACRWWWWRSSHGNRRPRTLRPLSRSVAEVVCLGHLRQCATFFAKQRSWRPH